MLYRARKLLRQCLETHWVGEWLETWKRYNYEFYSNENNE
jgi:hypothetical protein